MSTQAPGFIKLGKFQKPKHGDLYDIKDFNEMVEDGNIMDDDGMVGNIVVDDELTNLRLQGWTSWSDKKVEIDLEALLVLPGKVQIMWYNK